MRIHRDCCLHGFTSSPTALQYRFLLNTQIVFGILCSTFVDMFVIKFIIAASIDFLEAEISQQHILVSHSYIFTLLERGGNCNILFKFSSTLVIYIILATAVSLIILVFSACLCCNNLSDQCIKFALR